MRRKETLLIIGSTGVAALLLWLAVRYQSPRSARPAADAYLAGEMGAIQQLRAAQELRRLLLQKPHQAAFVICWQSKFNGRTGWSNLKYVRAKQTLIYTPYKCVLKGLHLLPEFPFVVNFSGTNPINTGCPDKYICKSVKEAFVIKANKSDTIGTLLLKSGCDKTCLLVT